MSRNDSGEDQPRRPLRSMVEMIAIVAATLFFALTIQALAVKPYRIPSGSMLPTLEPGQRILVDRFSHLLGSDPEIGDVTVFTPPRGAETQPGACGVPGQGPNYSGPASHQSCSRPTAQQAHTTFVKRVVGVPGDTIAVRDGHVIRNGKPAREAVRPILPWQRVQPRRHHRPARRLLPDGRQPRRLRRQPLLGPGAARPDHQAAIVTYWPLGRLGVL